VRIDAILAVVLQTPLQSWLLVKLEFSPFSQLSFELLSVFVGTSLGSVP